MKPLLIAALVAAPLSAFAQEIGTPPPIEEAGPFEERVSTGADPFETMKDAPPTQDPNQPMVADDDGDADAPPTMAEFETALSPHGRWVGTSRYGRVWVPRAPYPGWRPYTEGQWVYTADGWTFQSRYAWGWAPFHYGRWVYLGGHGWSWIPGYEYSPAWVQWRHGGDYVAWAPLGPAGVSASYYGTPSLWFAVRANTFGTRIHRRHALPTARSKVVFGATRIGLPTVTYVQKTTGRPVTRVSVRRNHRAARKARRIERRDRRQERRMDRRDDRKARRIERRDDRKDRRDDRKARRIERREDRKERRQDRRERRQDRRDRRRD